MTPNCSYCKMIGKSYAEYTSHFIHKTPNKNSRFTCPELLKRVCKNCPTYSHTWENCPLSLTKDSRPKDSRPLDKKVLPKKATNRFIDLDDDEDEQVHFDPKQLAGLTHKVQLQCIGEEIYAKIANQANAGMITGMLLEINIPELVEIVNTPERFNTFVKDANEILLCAV